MNIFMLLYLKYPDIRVEKEVKSLLKKGYKITILAANDGRQEEKVVINDLTIYRPLELSYNPLWKVVHYFWGSINFIDRWLLDKCRKYLRGKDFDVIHVHDLRLVKLGVMLANEFNMKIIADLHENYPAAIKSYTEDNSLKSIIRRYTVDRYSRWKAYEKAILKRTDVVIGVVDEARDRIIRDCDINPQKCYVVSNTESIDGFAKMYVDSEIINKYKDKFMISFIGGVDRHRGLDTVIKALPEIVSKIPNVFLVIVGGNNSEYEKYLKKITKLYKMERYVEFIEWVPFHKVRSYVEASKMGIIPQKATEHGNFTIPHKLFQYMSTGTPVIVSDCKPLKRIVNEYECGLVFNANDSVNLGEIISEEIDEKKLGENALMAVREKYNWENDELQLFALYEKIMQTVR